MTPEEILYYRERAAIERQLAADSTNPRVVEIHEKLAALYDQLVEGDEFQPAQMNDADVRSASRA